jgi:RNA-directed DNA polymerase
LGVPTNIKALAAFRYHVGVLWYSALRRRSQKDRTMWDKVGRLAKAFLPTS